MAPTRSDPVVRAASAALGGPAGAHSRGHPRLTPLVVVLIITGVTFTLGLATKTACAEGAWWHPTRQYANLCYSDLPYAYTAGGGAERVFPLIEDQGRYPVAAEPVVTAVLSYAGVVVAQAVAGWPDVDLRAAEPVSQLVAEPAVQREAAIFVGVAAVVLLLAALAAAAALVHTHRARPWDAMALAAAPVLAFAGTIGWDLVAVAGVSGALWAWARHRAVLSGALLGAGAAFAVYPAFVLVPIVVLAVREGVTRPAVRSAAAAAIAWAVLSLPGWLLAPDHWRAFALDYFHRPASGSVWELVAATGLDLGPATVTRLSVLSLVVLVTGLIVSATTTPRRPRIPQLALLVVVAVVLTARTYQPQHALWLLPLAALARPYWRDLLIWQAGEVAFFLTLWWHLGGYTDGGSNGIDEFYLVGIAMRLAGQLWLAGVVLRDVRLPWLDPVRADALTDDPAGGVLDEAPAR